VNAEVIARRLGDEWLIRDYSFKPYPCCRCNHTTIGIGIALYRQGISPERVRQVEIGLGTSNWMTVGEPYDAGRASVVHAQFNAAYGFARALIDGRVDLESYRMQALGDPGVAALASRTRVFDDVTIDPATQAARIRVTLAEGQEVELLQETMKGSPEDPMSDAELLAKFRGCLAYGVGAPQGAGDALVDAVENLDRAPDAAQALIAAFATAVRSGRRAS
jgi:2-methylcitrate dehydratase PrpD